MKKVLFSAVLLTIFTVACFAENKAQKQEPNWPTAQELLKKYGETMDSVRSFICKTETLSEGTGAYFDGKPVYFKRFTSSEIKFDGSRFSRHNYMWGINVVQPDGQEIKKEDAYYTSYLWDGKNLFQYTRTSGHQKSNNYPGTTSISYDAKVNEKMTERLISSPYHLIAYRGNYDERIDLFLSKEKKVTVRDKTERIGGSDCFVIDAQTDYGKFTLWIDPAHGYNIVQEEVQQREGDLGAMSPIPLKKGKSSSHFLKNVRFEKIDNIWVPMEFDLTVSGINDFGPMKENIHNKQIEMTLNPDSKAFGPFMPDDILNGSRVRISYSPNKSITKGISWQNGKVIDTSGKVIMDFTPKK